MSKQADFRLSKVAGPPEGVAWVWHTIELRSSPAWRARSNHLALLLELLELEHLRHGGAENGHLKQTFSQIASGGLSRKFIAATIEEGEALGLIDAQRGVRKSSTESHMTAFRLTYLPAKVIDRSYQNGKPYYTAPTDQWKRVTEQQAVTISLKARERRAMATGDRKNKTCIPEREPDQFQNGNSCGSRTGTGTAESRRNTRPQKVQTVPEREPPSISWPPAAELAPAEQQPENAPADLGQQQPIEAKRQRGTRIPDGAVLSDEARDFALGEGHPDPMREWADFTDYWKAQPGQKGVKLDWEATWRRWVRKAVDDGKRKAQRSGGGRQGGSDAHASLLAAGARIAAAGSRGPR